MMRVTLNKVLLWALFGICVLWLVIPFSMAILWSLVDPAEPWTPDHVLPPVMSFYRWGFLWEHSSLKTGMFNSYLLAPSAALVTLTLAMPTAFALGRINFPGKEVVKLLVLLPLVVPGFVTAIFFTAILFQMGLHAWRFGAILFAHSILFMPYAIRIMSVSFEQVRQDHIDAARDLGASPLARWRVAYFPALKPGILATLLIVFIYSIEEFAISFIVGSPNFTTIPTLLFTNLGANFIRPNAAVISLILVVPNVILMVFLERLLRSANPALSSGKG